MPPVEEWGRERLDALVELVGESFPRERLSPDELLACCWDDPGEVIARSDGTGAVSIVTRSEGDVVRGVIRLLVVHPGARRQGHARQLVEVAETWLRDHRASTVALGHAAPFYLWPGVDVQSMLAMLCLAESTGYTATGANLTISLPVTFRAPVPDGCTVRRALDDRDVASLDKLVRVEWPEHLDAVHRGVEQGTCIAAFDDGPDSSRALAFVCHSVNRGGWIEPIGVTPSCRRRGIGSALLGQACTDLMVASYRDVEVASPEPMQFFVRAGGAVSRVYRTYTKSL